MSEFHTTIDCLIDCEVLPKIAAHRQDYDLNGIVAQLGAAQMILRVQTEDQIGWMFRRTCDEPGCPCALDGTDEGVEKTLWEAINAFDLTNKGAGRGPGLRAVEGP